MADIGIRIQLDGLTGGVGTDTVQGISATDLVNNAITLGFASNKSYIYKYNSSIVALHSSPDVIQPWDTPAAGRHILQSSYEGSIDHDALTNFLDTEHKTATVIRAEVGTPLYVEVRTDDPGTPVTGQIWLRSDI